MMSERSTLLHLVANDGMGGATSAAMRIHDMLRLSPSIFSRVLVSRKFTDRDDVETLYKSEPLSMLLGQLRSNVSRAESQLRLQTKAPPTQNTARFRTSALKRIAQLSPDALMLHWIGSETISIEQIGRLQHFPGKIFWRLPDAWPLLGSSHYPQASREPSQSRIAYMNRLNKLDASTAKRKKEHWKRRFHLIAPSNWIRDLAVQSEITWDWPISVLPTPLDTLWWGSVSRKEARRRLGLREHDKVIVYGADGGLRNHRKGGDMFIEAISELSRRNLKLWDRCVALTFGNKKTHSTSLTLTDAGTLRPEQIRLHLAAADVVVVPSREDNLPQIALEAMASGAPVVGFDIGGMSDIVLSHVNGVLVAPFDIEALSQAIEWTVSSKSRREMLSDKALKTAASWDVGVVRDLYANLILG